ncbi:hypothetical protein BH11ARM2_BH11ARM2_37760 [soil metagenome]
MRRRGFATKSEAVRAVVKEAAGTEETPEAVRVRRERVLKEMWGLYAKPNMPLYDPREEDELWAGTGE